MLFLYTDGLTEARAGKELFGEERVFELLARFADRRRARWWTRSSGRSSSSPAAS